MKSKGDEPRHLCVNSHGGIVYVLQPLIFYNFRFFIPSLFIQDPAVIAIASKLMIIAAMFQLFDGFQVNMLEHCEEWRTSEYL